MHLLSAFPSFISFFVVVRDCDVISPSSANRQQEAIVSIEQYGQMHMLKRFLSPGNQLLLLKCPY